MDMQILVVEDDENIANTVRSFLLGFYDKQYNLIILDIMLPGMNGKELLRKFRKLSAASVLMITALTEDRHQIDAFDNHADDYVTKPFSMPILLSGMIQKKSN